MSRSRLKFFPALAALAAGLACALAAYAGFFRGPGDRILAAFAALEAPSPAAKKLLLIEYEESSLAAAGKAAWTRGHLIQALIQAREAGAESVIFVLPPELINRSESGQSTAVQELPGLFDREFALIESNIQTLFDAIRLGSMGPQEAPDYVERLIDLTRGGKTRLLAAALATDETEESRLAAEAARFAACYVSSSTMSFPGRWAGGGQEERQLKLLELPGLGADEAEPRLYEIRQAAGLAQIPPALVESCAGGGFHEAGPVMGNSLQRLSLIQEYRGIRLPQTVFKAILDRRLHSGLGLTGEGLIVKRFARRDAEEQGLRIPIDKNCALLVAPARGASGLGPRRLSLGSIVLCAKIEERLVSTLAKLKTLGLASEGRPPFDLAAAAETIRLDPRAEPEDYRVARRLFFSRTSEYLRKELPAYFAARPPHRKEPASILVPVEARPRQEDQTVSDQQRIENGLPPSQDPGAAESAADSATAPASEPMTDDENKTELEPRPALLAEAMAEMESGLRALAELERVRPVVQQNLTGSVCLIAARDQGGAQAALAETLLCSSFLREVPRPLIVASCACMGLAIAALALRLGAGRLLLAALGLGMASLCASAALLLAWKLCFNPIPALFTAAAAALSAGLARLIARAYRPRAVGSV